MPHDISLHRFTTLCHCTRALHTFVHHNVSMFLAVSYNLRHKQILAVPIYSLVLYCSQCSCFRPKPAMCATTFYLFNLRLWPLQSVPQNVSYCVCLFYPTDFLSCGVVICCRYSYGQKQRSDTLIPNTDYDCQCQTAEFRYVLFTFLPGHMPNYVYVCLIKFLSNLYDNNPG